MFLKSPETRTRLRQIKKWKLLHALGSISPHLDYESTALYPFSIHDVELLYWREINQIFYFFYLKYHLVFGIAFH